MKMISHRRDSGDPVLEAFTDQTYAWLDGLRADFERCMGHPFSGGNGVLLGNDVLVALYGHDASWARFDVAEIERWIRQRAPGLACALPSILADLCCFTNYLARIGVLEVERAVETEVRAREVTGHPPRPTDDAPVPSFEPWSPRNRAERRSQARAHRRVIGGRGATPRGRPR